MAVLPVLMLHLSCLPLLGCHLFEELLLLLVVVLVLLPLFSGQVCHYWRFLRMTVASLMYLTATALQIGSCEQIVIAAWHMVL